MVGRLSVAGRSIVGMSPSCEPVAAPAPVPSVAEANAAIRRFTRGRTSWSRAELAELARLRFAWLEAVRLAELEYVPAA